MSRRLQSTSSRSPTRISLTPLIDTVLVLLVIFMVTAPLTHHVLRLDLPGTHSQESAPADKQEIIEVHIDKNKLLYINGTVVSQDSLISALKILIENMQNPLVVIYADESLSYKNFIELVVDYIKQVSKIKYVFVATDYKHLV